MWPDRRVLDLLNIELPIIQAPMANSTSPELVAAVSNAGGLGSLGCAYMTGSEIVGDVDRIRSLTKRPFNLNFFCHVAPVSDPVRQHQWLQNLGPYFSELGVAPPNALSGPAPFNEQTCDLVVQIAPAVVSFQFGLPEQKQVDRLRTLGCKILSSATNVREARYLADHGVDAIIAQGFEAGGHRGTFAGDYQTGMIGGIALIPQVADAVTVPVIAAGGIGDGRGVAAALVLGASAVQIGTAFLFCAEARISRLHLAALTATEAERTVVTNVFSGRPARAIANRLTRELGPIAREIPDFPLVGSSIAPLRRAAEETRSTDFSPLWSGQAAAMGRRVKAGELTLSLAKEALERLKQVVTVQSP